VGEVHIDVSLEQWSEFVAGRRSLANRDKEIARFEGVLDRKSAPKGSERMK
jgi:hypothetical protein